MALLKRILLGSLMVLLACGYASGGRAGAADREFRIGLIGVDPGQVLHDFDPFVRYLRSSLGPSGVRSVSVFVAKDLDQMQARLEEGTLDFVLTSAFPIIEMEDGGLSLSLLALRGEERGSSAVFFVRKESDLRGLGDLKGKTLVFGTPSSTTSYALARAELERYNLALRESSAFFVSADAVRYEFAGEALNQAFRVILERADAGVFGTDDWSALPRRERAKLRIIHRSAPLPGLIGSFHPFVPREVRDAVETALIGMSGNQEGRDALAAALHITKFERMTDEDRFSIYCFRKCLYPGEWP